MGPGGRRRASRPRRPLLPLAGLPLLLLALAAGATGAGAGQPSEAAWDGLPVHRVRPRSHARDPSPACCAAAGCAAPRSGRHAFLVSVRTPQYVPLLRQLVCSMAMSQPPGQLLLVIGAEGDGVGAADVAALSRPLFEVRYLLVPELRFENKHAARFALNWIKLHAWNMTEYDSITSLDTDMAVLGDLTHLRSLPTAFAWAPRQGVQWSADGRSLQPHWQNKGGAVFLRPCRAVFEHMVRLLSEREELRFPTLHAEQTFLDWYFHWSGMRLPLEYNLNPSYGLSQCSEAGGGAGDQGGKGRGGCELRTLGGEAPVVLHFAEVKPWKMRRGDQMYGFAHRCGDDGGGGDDDDSSGS